MKALIVGGSCLLGRYLALTAPAGWQVAATWYTNYPAAGYPAGLSFYQMDVCSRSQVGYVLGRVRPDMVLHLASVGDVDWCETHCAEARRINVEGTATLQAECDRLGAGFVYTSSNAVYDGERPPYAEDAPREPVNRYGVTRRDAEDMVSGGRRWLTLRLFLLYGWPPPGARSNWAVKVVESLRAGRPLKLVDDVRWQPTYVLDAARAVWHLSGMLADGSLRSQAVNLAPAVGLSLHEFGLLTADVFGLDRRLIAATNSEGLRVARRPRDTSYDVVKAGGLGVELLPAAEGLRLMWEEEEFGVEFVKTQPARARPQAV